MPDTVALRLLMCEIRVRHIAADIAVENAADIAADRAVVAAVG